MKIFSINTAISVLRFSLKFDTKLPTIPKLREKTAFSVLREFSSREGIKLFCIA